MFNEKRKKMKLKIWMICLLVANLTLGQQKEYQLSTHILDIASGKPAPSVQVGLYKQVAENWVLVAEKTTDANGRIGSFLPNEQEGNTGIYKLVFYTFPYFEKQGLSSFYPQIEVVFAITDEKHYHVPITVSPFGYSTYRGS